MRVLLAVVLAITAFTWAQAGDVCDSLWIERNSYFAEAGYCFKTPKAIRHFGNAGCLYDEERDLPLSRATRARISEITRVEHVLQCRS